MEKLIKILIIVLMILFITKKKNLFYKLIEIAKMIIMLMLIKIMLVFLILMINSQMIIKKNLAN